MRGGGASSLNESGGSGDRGERSRGCGGPYVFVRSCGDCGGRRVAGSLLQVAVRELLTIFYHVFDSDRIGRELLFVWL